MSRFLKLIVALVVVALASGFRATMKMVSFSKQTNVNYRDFVVAICFLALQWLQNYGIFHDWVKCIENNVWLYLLLDTTL